MDMTPKPSGYGISSSGNFDEYRGVQSPKPLPPNSFNFELGTSDIRAKRDNGKQEDTELGDFTIVEQPNEDKGDFGVIDVLKVVKSLDANRYATKKTIAQGMLDIALLTANASQLKYILQVGKQHEFYTLMLTLICMSIGLQVLQGVIIVLLGASFNINKEQDQPRANVWNDITVALMIITVVVNIVISSFDMRSSDEVTDKFSTGML